MADGAADERQEVVIAERAFQAGVVVAQQGDEQRLHDGDDQRIAAEEDPAAEAEPGVEQRVEGAEGEDGVEDGEPIDGPATLTTT